jgi:hypothetical protein
MVSKRVQLLFTQKLQDMVLFAIVHNQLNGNMLKLRVLCKYHFSLLNVLVRQSYEGQISWCQFSPNAPLRAGVRQSKRQYSSALHHDKRRGIALVRLHRMEELELSMTRQLLRNRDVCTVYIHAYGTTE